MAGSVCNFCHLKDSSNEDLGEMYRKGTITAHKNCMYFSSGLCQGGETNNGLVGFLEADVRKELSRGFSHPKKCCVCGMKGMFVGCADGRCGRAGHLPCLISKEYLLQFYDNFKVYCPLHRPKQTFPSSSTGSHDCPICLSYIPRPSMSPHSVLMPFEVLLTPCCQKPCHRSCIQTQARSAGVHYFRCPVCNNQELFKNEMLRMGIEVPIRDASWELCDQFDDLHSPKVHCSLPICTHSHGRNCHTEDNQVIDCKWCGQCIGHYHCIKNYLHDSSVVIVTQRGMDREYICSDCAPVYRNSRKRKLTTETSPTDSTSLKRPAPCVPSLTPQGDSEKLPSPPQEALSSSLTPQGDSEKLPLPPQGALSLTHQGGSGRLTPQGKYKVLSSTPQIEGGGRCEVQCACIYGREYTSPRGAYRLLSCQKCNKSLGHSECLSASSSNNSSKNGENSGKEQKELICDGCGQRSSCDGCGQDSSCNRTDDGSDEVIVIVDDSDDNVILISDCSDSEEKSCGHGSLNSGRGSLSPPLDVLFVVDEEELENEITSESKCSSVCGERQDSIVSEELHNSSKAIEIQAPSPDRLFHRLLIQAPNQPWSSEEETLANHSSGVVMHKGASTDGVDKFVGSLHFKKTMKESFSPYNIDSHNINLVGPPSKCTKPLQSCKNRSIKLLQPITKNVYCHGDKCDHHSDHVTDTDESYFSYVGDCHTQ